jgi:hypothetical protein
MISRRSLFSALPASLLAAKVAKAKPQEPVKPASTGSLYGHSPLEEVADLVTQYNLSLEGVKRYEGEEYALVSGVAGAILRAFGLGNESRMLSFEAWLRDIHKRTGVQEVLRFA